MTQTIHQTQNNDKSQIWSEAAARLKTQTDANAYAAHIQPLTVQKIAAGVLHLSTPNTRSIPWLERLQPQILKVLPDDSSITNIVFEAAESVVDSAQGEPVIRNDLYNVPGTVAMGGYTPVFDKVAKKVGTVTSLTFGVVWRHCQMRRGVCDASVDNLADMTGLNPKTIRRHLARLVEAGYLIDTTPGQRHKPHIYKDAGKVRIRAIIDADIDD